MGIGISLLLIAAGAVLIWAVDLTVHGVNLVTVGWIEAETSTEADAGDHTFFIADVLSIDHGPSHHALVYRESTYHSV